MQGHASELGTMGDRQGEGGRSIKMGDNSGERGEREIENQKEGEQEVNAVESVDGWEKWLQSGWYRGIVLFLLRGSLEGEG